MKLKLDGKSFLAIAFVAIIIAGGILTFAINPKQVFGGLVKGYISAPTESSFLKKIGNSFSTFDGRMNEYFAFHDTSIHAYGFVQKLLGRTLIHDVDKSSEVLKLENDYLTFKRSGNSDYTALKDYLLDLKTVTNSYGGELLYIPTFNKDTSPSDLLPKFWPYESTSNIDDIKPLLEANGVSVLDYDEIVEQENIDKYSMFFKTDHHWTARTGLWAAQVISEKINDDFQFDLDTDILDISNYSIKTYKSSFLGSEGKRVGALYAGVDDFEIVKPTFPTHLTVKMGDINFDVTGSFSDTMIFEENITPDNLLNKQTTAYCAYMQGNHALVEAENHDLPEGKTALLIMDSYGCVVAPYLTLAFQELDCIDIRYYTDPIEEYVKSTSPDVVIYAISSYQ